MKDRLIMLLCAGLAIVCPNLQAQTSNPPPATSSWVFFDNDHRLAYQKDALGNRIMDFSFAGYKAGGVTLPSAIDVPATVVVNPAAGDNTQAIQSAIDTVSALPLNADGFRGAVQLAPGTFNVSSTIKITASGVILRGSGLGATGTIINLTGNPFLFLQVAGSGSAQNVGSAVLLSDSYVPSGAVSFNVTDASSFSVGNTVRIRRPVTAAWIHLMGMDTLVRSGAPQNWISAGSTVTTDRVIAAITGNQITLDVPLTDSFDSQFLNPPGSSIQQYTFPGRITQVGVEGFSVIAIPKNVDITQPQFQGLSVTAVMNAWVRNVIFQDTQNTMSVDTTVKQMTFDNVIVNHTAPHSGDGPADFALSGTQLFANNCAVLGLGSNVWAALTQSRVTGPIVLLNFHGDDRGFAPHQRWATGMLCDGCTFPNSHTEDKAGVAYSDRGNLGSGQGWDSGWAVAWNVAAKTFTIQQPPGSQNFCIGCVGSILTQAEPGKPSPLLANGIYDSFGTPVTPSSLYLEQLFERLGPQAVINIGYLSYLRQIDTIAPTTTATVSPAPNANGWNNSDVAVTLNSADNQFGTGVALLAYSASGAQAIASTVVPGTTASFNITNEGITNVSFFGTDFAQNVETARNAVVKLDKTPPEAFQEFDPQTHDVVIFGRDALSGVAPGPIAPTSVVSLSRHDHDSDEDVDHGDWRRDDDLRVELRTYTILDLAGNPLLLTEKVTRSHRFVVVRIMSLQYGNGPVIAMPRNLQTMTWSMRRNGTLRELAERLEVGKERHEQEISSHFDARENRTFIRDESTRGFTVKPGLVLLQLATQNGNLVVQF